MSHFTKIKTRITDPTVLQKSLVALGFQAVEVHTTPQNLFGYLGDQRADKAEVIIRRQHVGHASNDIGFKLSSDGTFDAIISEFDQHKYNSDWLNGLNYKYAETAVRGQLAEQGFDLIDESCDAEGSLHLVLRRSVF